MTLSSSLDITRVFLYFYETIMLREQQDVASQQTIQINDLFNRLQQEPLSKLVVFHLNSLIPLFIQHLRLSFN